MATYTGKNISSGYVNIRTGASTGSGTNGRVEKGASVQMTDYNQRWYSVPGGYVVGDFFQLNTSGIGSAVTANFTGTVNVRYEPSTAAGTNSVIFQLSVGAAVTKISTSGTWTKITCANGTGWISSQYLGTGSGSGTGTGTTKYYDNVKAINYAKSHTDDSGGGTIAAGANTSFPRGTTNQCANFVHQCLVAGGLPMFNGWHYKITGIPANWDDSSSKWTYTKSGLDKLTAKNRLTQVEYNMVQPGDVIYSYDASQPAGKEYTHVTIATSNFGYFSAQGKYGATVCGQTHNHLNRFKELTSSNCKCYRVNGTITIGSGELQCSLPATGSGGNAI